MREKMVIILFAFFILITINLNSQLFKRVIDQDTHLTTFSSSSYGCNWVDVDNNNFPDIFVANGSNQVNHIYYTSRQNQIVPNFHTALMFDNLSSFAASWADYDNDGLNDLLVVNSYFHGINLYRNINGYSFEINQANQLGSIAGSFFGCAWGDYDNDGLLDIIITDWQTYSPNIVLRNNGNGSFSNVYNAITNDFDQMMSPTWIDYDDDGDLDLFIATDYYNYNRLYENDGAGNFTRIYDHTLVNDLVKSNSASWADYDNDGDFDLFVGTTGNDNNRFYRNDGNGNFTEIFGLNLVTDGGYSRSSCWGDFDNDGYIDLFVANGYLEQFRNNFLYMNNGDGTFTRVMQGAIVEDGGSSLGVSAADYDHDGDLDLFVVNGCGYADQINFLYENISEPSHNWLKIKCEGTVSNRSAIGTKLYLYLTINGKKSILSRYISSNSGRASQSDYVVHFGTGNTNQADSLVIKWPSGIHQTITNPRLNRLHRIIELNETSDLPITKNQKIIKNISNFPNPFNPITQIKFEMLYSSEVILHIYNTKGQKVTSLGNKNLRSGEHSITWNGKDRNNREVASGFYFYQFEVNGKLISELHKMLFLK